MLLFDAVLPRMPIGAEALLEAGLMAGVLLPIIFFLVFRPFAQHVADLEEAQAALRGAYDDLERRVQERTTEIRRRNRELSVLYSIDRATAQSLDLAEILNDALDKVLEVLEVEAGGIFLLEPDGETMLLRVHHDLSDEFVVNWTYAKALSNDIWTYAKRRKTSFSPAIYTPSLRSEPVYSEQISPLRKSRT